MRRIDTGKTDEAEICDAHELAWQIQMKNSKGRFKLTCTTKYRGKSSMSIVPIERSDINHPIETLDINSPPPKCQHIFSTKVFWGGSGGDWGNTLRVSFRPFCVLWIKVCLAQLIYSTFWWSCDLQLIRDNWWWLKKYWGSGDDDDVPELAAWWISVTQFGITSADSGSKSRAAWKDSKASIK